MPIHIYRVTPEGQEDEAIGRLCEDVWLLWPQMDALVKWLEHTGASLPSAEYVVDVGFCWRRDAATGGPVLEPAALRRMGELGMSLHLSEYPGFPEDWA